MSAPENEMTPDAARLKTAAAVLRAAADSERLVDAQVLARVADWLDAEAFLVNGLEPFTELVGIAMKQASGGKATLSLGRADDGTVTMRASSWDQALRVADAILD